MIPMADGKGRYSDQQMAIILQSYLGLLGGFTLRNGNGLRACRVSGEGIHSLYSCKGKEIVRHNRVVEIIVRAIILVGLCGRVMANDAKKYRVADLNRPGFWIEPGDIVIGLRVLGAALITYKGIFVTGG